MWGDGIIPFSMEGVRSQVDSCELGLWDNDAFGIKVGVEFGLNREACLCGCSRDKLDDSLECTQRFAAPVHGDE